MPTLLNSRLGYLFSTIPRKLPPFASAPVQVSLVIIPPQVKQHRISMCVTHF
ncbi:predicted protein [Botrytis cinerea T4]|uniref:Uncharacterized protein n=1 Tax=Botryotinia fuckeliana (strain T4) TaxID=999810 RepID=G2YJ57_BOTF4|nr:predicted protein [Botrytis cinerea T4]